MIKYRRKIHTQKRHSGRTVVGPIYPLSQTGIRPKVSDSRLQGSLPGPIMGFHRNGYVNSSGRREGSALSTCPPPPFMLGCDFSEGF